METSAKKDEGVGRVEPGEKAPSVDHKAELNTLFGTDGGVAETSSDSRTQLGDLFTAPSDDP